MTRITRNANACYGCRFCELICSLHLLGVFSPEGGAITVRKDNRSGKIDWRLGASCDHCEGESLPLCVKYCTYGALMVSNEVL